MWMMNGDLRFETEVLPKGVLTGIDVNTFWGPSNWCWQLDCIRPRTFHSSVLRLQRYYILKYYIRIWLLICTLVTCVRRIWHHKFPLILSCQETIVQSGPTTFPLLKLLQSQWRMIYIQRTPKVATIITCICHQRNTWTLSIHCPCPSHTSFSAPRPHHCIPECSQIKRWSYSRK